MLRPSEHSMHNCSLAKLELLVLKRAVTEKFRDYFLGSKFTVYTNNNPLAYIQTSKLGASQIHWLSKLAVFDFNIRQTNKAADTLSQHPGDTYIEMESNSDNDGKDLVVLLYTSICNRIKLVLKDTKSHILLKKKHKLLVMHWKGRLV